MFKRGHNMFFYILYVQLKIEQLVQRNKTLRFLWCLLHVSHVCSMREHTHKHTLTHSNLCPPSNIKRLPLSLSLSPSLSLPLNPFGNWLCGCTSIWNHGSGRHCITESSATPRAGRRIYSPAQHVVCFMLDCRAASGARTLNAAHHTHTHTPVLDHYISCNLLDHEEGCIQSAAIKIYHPWGTINEGSSMTNVGTWVAERRAGKWRREWKTTWSPDSQLVPFPPLGLYKEGWIPFLCPLLL